MWQYVAIQKSQNQKIIMLCFQDVDSILKIFKNWPDQSNTTTSRYASFNSMPFCWPDPMQYNILFERGPKGPQNPEVMEFGDVGLSNNKPEN